MNLSNSTISYYSHFTKIQKQCRHRNLSCPTYVIVVTITSLSPYYYLIYNGQFLNSLLWNLNNHFWSFIPTSIHLIHLNLNKRIIYQVSSNSFMQKRMENICSKIFFSMFWRIIMINQFLYINPLLLNFYWVENISN